MKALVNKWRQTEQDYVDEYTQKGFQLYNKMKKKGNRIINLDYEYYKNLSAPGTSIPVVASGLYFKSNKTLPKKIVRKNSFGEVIAEFESITEAATKSGINRSLVSIALNDANNKEWNPV